MAIVDLYFTTLQRGFKSFSSDRALKLGHRGPPPISHRHSAARPMKDLCGVPLP